MKKIVSFGKKSNQKKNDITSPKIFRWLKCLTVIILISLYVFGLIKENINQ